jgi:hypothetical protein
MYRSSGTSLAVDTCAAHESPMPPAPISALLPPLLVLMLLVPPLLEALVPSPAPVADEPPPATMLSCEVDPQAVKFKVAVRIEASPIAIRLPVRMIQIEHQWGALRSAV